MQQLGEVIISDGLEHGLRNIYDGTFSGCTSLLTVNIPSSKKDISYSAFDGCDNRHLLSDDAFHGCHRLSLVFPQEITDFMSANNIDWWKSCKIHN